MVSLSREAEKEAQVGGDCQGRTGGLGKFLGKKPHGGETRGMEGESRRAAK